MFLHARPVLVVLGALALVSLASPGMATTPLDAAKIEAKIQEAKVRLALTPEQESQLKPVVSERSEKIAAIRGQYGGDTSRKARRAMYEQIRPVQKDYEAKVRTILTDAQEAEWDKMRKESWQRLREAYRTGEAVE
jgi:LAS superfamily LD-carboxypeptidase LdcB